MLFLAVSVGRTKSSKVAFSEFATYVLTIRQRFLLLPPVARTVSTNN